MPQMLMIERGGRVCNDLAIVIAATAFHRCSVAAGESFLEQAITYFHSVGGCSQTLVN